MSYCDSRFIRRQGVLREAPEEFLGALMAGILKDIYKMSLSIYIYIYICIQYIYIYIYTVHMYP